MNKKYVKAKITKAIRSGVSAMKEDIDNLIPKTLTEGKAYEAYILGLICKNLKAREGYTLKLVKGKKITLKSSPGPVNNDYPHIEAFKNNAHIANIWTDIEFTSLSAWRTSKTILSLGDFHEMDVAVVSPNCSKRPNPDEIFLLAECKNTGYQKNLLREILGVRRELSFLKDPTSTSFTNWPVAQVPAYPPSCVLVYSTDSSVLSYSAPGNTYGINFFYEPL